MTNNTSDPFPAIAEADATGDLADLFQDIRATLGVPVVNLIWRHLATIPGGLDFAWNTVKPLYVSDDIARHANGLRQTLKAPDVTGRDLQAFSEQDLAQFATILSSYERSNAMNLIGLSALLAAIDGKTEASLPQIETHDDAAVLGEMPIPTAIGDMPNTTRALVQRLAIIGGADGVMPTMYRHLSHWPPMLEQILAVLEPLERADQIQPAIAAAKADGLRIGASLAHRAGPVAPDISPEARDAVRASVSHFVNGAIGKMVVIVAILRHAFPGIAR